MRLGPIDKLYDRVRDYKLFRKLLELGVPVVVVRVRKIRSPSRIWRPLLDG